MTPLFAYLLKVIVCSAILYGYYLVALRNKVFHSWNRFYLMACMVLSILLPLMEPYIIAPASNESKVITALQVVAGADEYVMDLQGNASMSWDVTLLMNAGYVLISLLVMGWLFFGLTSIYKMVRKYPKQKMQDVLFMNTQEPGTPFSYFRYLFWNKAIDPSSENGQKILEHELVHIREKHSHDKLFVHLVLTIYWANPFFWLIRKELAMIHEFIADQKTVSDTESFAQMILSASFPGHSNLLTNAFFQSSIKRRITMITKNKNPKYQYISRILLIPVLFVLIFTFAVKADEIIHTPTVDLDKKVTNKKDKSFFSQETNRDILANAILRSTEDYFNKNVVIKNISMDTLPAAKKVKTVTVTYEDGSKETLTDAEYKKRNQPKVVKGIKLTKMDTVNIINAKDESVFLIDGKELPKGTMPIEVTEISSIKVVDDGNGKKEVHIYKKQSRETKASSPLNEVTVVGRPSNSVVLKGQKTNGVDPLYIINGKEHTKEEMSAYEPNQIESISVLKGDAAISKYGEKGKNGVIMITLKKQS